MTWKQHDMTIRVQVKLQACTGWAVHLAVPYRNASLLQAPRPQRKHAAGLLRQLYQRSANTCFSMRCWATRPNLCGATTSLHPSRVHAL